jgi:hypothetical protein
VAMTPAGLIRKLSAALTVPAPASSGVAWELCQMTDVEREALERARDGHDA